MASLLKKRRDRSAVLSFRAPLGTLLAIRVKCTLRPLYKPIIRYTIFVTWLSHHLSTNGSTRSSKILYKRGMAIVGIDYSGSVFVWRLNLIRSFSSLQSLPSRSSVQCWVARIGFSHSDNTLARNIDLIT